MARRAPAGFDAIADAELVLSTYALLSRDAESLLPVSWHLVVLDEAQAIKNPASKAHQLVCQLQARQRLCLTGTPIENHLGELFAQMSFLMPGLLGDRQRFTRLLELQQRKNALAQGILDGAGGSFSSFDEGDLEVPLRPLA